MTDEFGARLRQFGFKPGACFFEGLDVVELGFAVFLEAGKGDGEFVFVDFQRAGFGAEDFVVLLAFFEPGLVGG